MNNTTSSPATQAAMVNANLTVQNGAGFDIDHVNGVSGVYTIERVSTSRDLDTLHGEGRAFLVYYRRFRSRKPAQSVTLGSDLAVVVLNSVISIMARTALLSVKGHSAVHFGYFTFDEALAAVRRHNNMCVSRKQQAEVNAAHAEALEIHQQYLRTHGYKPTHYPTAAQQVEQDASSMTWEALQAARTKAQALDALAKIGFGVRHQPGSGAYLIMFGPALVTLNNRADWPTREAAIDTLLECYWLATSVQYGA